MRSDDSRHRPSRTRNLVSLVFSFFLALALTCMAAILVLHVGLFSERGILSVFDDDYYRYVLTYIDDQAYHYTIPTGIDPEVARDVFAVEDVQYDVDQSVLATLRGTQYEIDTTQAEETLMQRVNDFFTDNGVKLSSETEEIASAYVDEIMDIYRDVIKVPGLDALSSARIRYMKYSLVGCVASALVVVVLITTILKLHHFVHRGLRYVAYGTGGAALMCFVAPFIAYQSGSYKGLNLTPQYFYHLGISLVAHVLKLSMAAGLVFLVVTVVLVVCVSALRGRTRHHHSSGRHSR